MKLNGRAQLRRGVHIVTAKEEKHPKIGASVEVIRVERDQRLQLWNSELGLFFMQELQGFFGMCPDLLLSAVGGLSNAEQRE